MFGFNSHPSGASSAEGCVRFTWEIIKRHRADRALVLTTHSMEEADCLADRIAIMAQGQVAAVGSSMDLKDRYGVGYTLTFALSGPSQSPGSGWVLPQVASGRSAPAHTFDQYAHKLEILSMQHSGTDGSQSTGLA